MIYTCQHDGAYFPTKVLEEAIRNKQTFIKCPYCGKLTEFQEMRSSHIARAYDFLSDGSFSEAQTHFLHAIEDAKRHGKQPSPDVYLGQALVQFRVQTLFSDEDTQRVENPQLICHTCNEMYFSQSTYFLNAKACIERSQLDETTRYVELTRLQFYADYIDDIKHYYDAERTARGHGFRYDTFIAYEDKNLAQEAQGFRMAHGVRNHLPDGIKNVFLPDIDEYGSEEEYEAAILYAIHHTKCMTVVTDNDIDFRLTSIYARFFNLQRSKYANTRQIPLGFVRYRDHITVILPDGNIAKNVYDFDTPEGFIDFVCLHNNIIHTAAEEKHETDGVPTQTVQISMAAPAPVGNTVPYTALPSGQYVFGHYPQRREDSLEIERYFAQYPMPTTTDSNGWDVLFTSAKGMPYTWYRDEWVNGKKYRAVYFKKFRDVYSVQPSKIPAKEQRQHGYLPLHLYCFAFEPLIWNTEELSSGYVSLVADQGIDAREYNNHDMDNQWESSTLHSWLNFEFLHTAFEENEQEYLCTLDGNDSDKIFLIDKLLDKKYYESRHNAILGSDYYKCIGGMGDRSINSYWINAGDVDSYREAGVIFPNYNREYSTRYVDCTVVAVLPKIILRLK